MKYKVGDLVELDWENEELKEIGVNNNSKKIAEIVENDESSIPYRVLLIGTKELYWCRESYLIGTIKILSINLKQMRDEV